MVWNMDIWDRELLWWLSYVNDIGLLQEIE